MKFWKESRTLTVALSLVLCCMIGVAWATEDCDEPDESGDCGAAWADADEWSTWASEMKEASENERDAYNQLRPIITGCASAHGFKQPIIVYEPLYFLRQNYANLDKIAGDQSWLSGHNKEISASALMQEGEDFCNGDPQAQPPVSPNHYASQSKYSAAANAFYLANGLFDDAKDSYVEAMHHLRDAEGCLLKQEYDEEEGWIDCSCWE